ncbi:MAG TPA: lasso peptide biosynthesis B2 protein [Methylomirabilota bacterium]|nr:lasso peptide biosynthesis B2 protein [Methylomirabilota bacterium]
MWSPIRSGLRRRLGQIAALPAHEQWLLARAWALLLVMPAAARLLPLRTLLTRLGRAPARHQRRRISAERLGSLVAAAGRHHFFAPTCLHRALALYRLLAIHGHRAELVLGARRAGGGLEAHAWLEQAGRLPPGDAGASSYQPLLRWEGEP